MEGEEGGGMRLSKRFPESASGEVDYKNKSGTAWSHSYLNQKPWHPLSYPNQRRKWIAEQTHAHRDRRADEVAREYAQEQEFFRQTALISKKEKEKVEMMKAVSFMYVRPPGYNPESAKAAEIADEQKMQEQTQNPHSYTDTASAMPPEDTSGRDPPDQVKKKPRPKDVFGRALPTDEEFSILKNAPRLETGAPARAKPFGFEVRNVKCLRCGNYGHQSGDRECPLKDVVMPNEESRLKRDDPLTAILAHTDRTEPLKWELKQKPGMSPPRGGFKPDDPNQQIVAEDIFDEYGGFLSGGSIPELLANFSPSKLVRKKNNRKKQQSPRGGKESEAPKEDGLCLSKNVRRPEKKYSGSGRHHKGIRQKHSYSSTSEDSYGDDCHGQKRIRSKHSYPSAESGSTGLGRHRRRRKHEHSYVKPSESSHPRHRKSRHKTYTSEDSESSELCGNHKRSKHKH